jgi:nucleotide-binding universal stress UspA family protein
MGNPWHIDATGSVKVLNWRGEAIAEAIAMTNVKSENKIVGRSIVVGVDGSESSCAALRWAAKIAPAIGCTIEAVIAWELPTTVWEVVSTEFPTCLEYPTPFGTDELIPIHMRPDLDAKKVLEEAVNFVFGRRKPLGLIITARQGHPAEVLLEASKSAELLIVGRRGTGGFSGLLQGSISSTCAEHADCPVLVVHAEPKEVIVPVSERLAVLA